MSSIRPTSAQIASQSVDRLSRGADSQASSKALPVAVYAEQSAKIIRALRNRDAEEVWRLEAVYGRELVRNIEHSMCFVPTMSAPIELDSYEVSATTRRGY